VSAFVAFVLAALLLVPALLVAIPVHEMGHAAAAYFQGDRSVRYFGYFTLDPRRFLDPLGVIAVFIALVGWGRRVPVQPNRINTMRQRLVFELGGPAANLLVAIVLGILWRNLSAMGLQSTFTLSLGVLGAAIYAIVFLNLSIFAFQLLPIPGLDGWDVVETLFRSRNPRFFFNVSMRRQQIWIGAIVVVFLFQIFQHANLLQLVMSPFYAPASLISLGSLCSGYAISSLAGLYPCLPLGG
jgi:Zn-dependent protease